MEPLGPKAGAHEDQWRQKIKKSVSELQMVIKSGLDQLPDTIDPYINPGLLSGGEKELLNLTTAMQSSPDILIIDDGFILETSNTYT